MNGHYLHLLVNHAALWSAVFGAGFLLLGLLRPSPANQRGGLSLLVLAMVFTVMSVQSGEAAEDVVENLSGYEKTTDAGRANRRLVHEHEEAGEGAQIGAFLAGAAGLIGLWLLGRDRSKATRFALWAAFVLGGMLVTALVRVSNLGGQIRRPELRAEAAAVAPAEDND